MLQIVQFATTYSRRTLSRTHWSTTFLLPAAGRELSKHILVSHQTRILMTRTTTTGTIYPVCHLPYLPTNNTNDKVMHGECVIKLLCTFTHTHTHRRWMDGGGWWQWWHNKDLPLPMQICYGTRYQIAHMYHNIILPYCQSYKNTARIMYKDIWSHVYLRYYHG